jgi:hypothetical protein
MRQHLRLRPWGARGLVLVILGIIWSLLGTHYVLVPWTPNAREALFVPAALAPQWVWGMGWLVAGLLAIVSSRWPPTQDSWGYVALGTTAMLWACFYLFGALRSDLVSGATGSLVWLAVCGLLYAVSRLAEPPIKGLQ